MHKPKGSECLSISLGTTFCCCFKAMFVYWREFIAFLAGFYRCTSMRRRLKFKLNAKLKNVPTHTMHESKKSSRNVRAHFFPLTLLSSESRCFADAMFADRIHFVVNCLWNSVLQRQHEQNDKYTITYTSYELLIIGGFWFTSLYKILGCRRNKLCI